MSKHYSWTAFSFTIFIWLFIVGFLTAWTDREVDWALSKVKGRPVDIHWGWSCALVVLPVTGPLPILFNIGCEIYAAVED